MANAARSAGGHAAQRIQAATRAFLAALAEHPDFAQTLLVEIIGAGPEATRRRDEMLLGFAGLLDAENAEAARRGLLPRFASPHDSIAIVGAINELVSRHVRLGEPADILELAPVIDRLISGLVASSDARAWA